MGFVDNNDRAFAFSVRRFFNPRFEIGVRNLLGPDFSGAESRGRQLERDSENEFCHTHSFFREPGMPVITAARASVCAIQGGAARIRLKSAPEPTFFRFLDTPNNQII